jgi:pimeloyl-ACP methyl ester carboxylesterase
MNDTGKHVIDEGTGPPVLCLHGFPQNAEAFDGVASALVTSGFRVIRFNQRGYADGLIQGRAAYTVARLAADAVDVLSQRGVDSCIIVGHDLGGIVAWEIGRTSPSRVRSLVIVGVPHPGAFLLSLLGGRQIVHSWHFLLAQSTCLATAMYSPKQPTSRERLASRLDKAGLSLADSRRYLDHLAGGHRFVGAIRWYQAMPLSPLRSSFFISRNRVEILWGDADSLTGRLAIRLSRLFVSRKSLRVTTVRGGTHWLVDEHTDEIAQAVFRANV